MFVTEDIRYIGVNDHKIDLFEGQYKVPNGMSYNSYAILDEKIAIMDTVDKGFTHEWLDNIQNTLGNRKPDYLVVQHMEPDHSANIFNFAKAYPEATIVSSARAFQMMKNFFGTDFADNRIVVGEGDTLCLGQHTLAFVTAPMVHWPEVMVTYDQSTKTLFSADAFGTFGALNSRNQCTITIYLTITSYYTRPISNTSIIFHVNPTAQVSPSAHVTLSGSAKCKLRSH